MTSDPQWQVSKEQPFASTAVSSWSNFTNLIEKHFLDWSEYIYRGQRSSLWALRSKFDRWLCDANDALKNFDPAEGLDADDKSIVEPMPVPESVGKRDVLLANQLKRFKNACCGRRGASPAELGEDQWWALGRHVGLDTPLLDWTRSPYVACFFAMQSPAPSTSGIRSVWAFSHLHMRSILINQNDNVDKNENEIECVELLELAIDENTRSLSQSGLFTRTPSGESIEDFVRERMDLAGNDPVLYRIDIPEQLREAFLRSLDAMNINSATLFPDLIGAAEHSNRGLEQEFSNIAWRLKPEFIRRMLSLEATH